jgi:hypothetical protein
MRTALAQATRTALRQATRKMKVTWRAGRTSRSRRGWQRMTRLQRTWPRPRSVSPIRIGRCRRACGARQGRNASERSQRAGLHMWSKASSLRSAAVPARRFFRGACDRRPKSNAAARARGSRRLVAVKQANVCRRKCWDAVAVIILRGCLRE